MQTQQQLGTSCNTYADYRSARLNDVILQLSALAEKSKTPGSHMLSVFCKSLPDCLNPSNSAPKTNAELIENAAAKVATHYTGSNYKPQSDELRDVILGLLDVLILSQDNFKPQSEVTIDKEVDRIFYEGFEQELNKIKFPSNNASTAVSASSNQPNSNNTTGYIQLEPRPRHESRREAQITAPLQKSDGQACATPKQVQPQDFAFAGRNGGLFLPPKTRAENIYNCVYFVISYWLLLLKTMEPETASPLSIFNGIFSKSLADWLRNNRFNNSIAGEEALTIEKLTDYLVKVTCASMKESMKGKMSKDEIDGNSDKINGMIDQIGNLFLRVSNFLRGRDNDIKANKGTTNEAMITLESISDDMVELLGKHGTTSPVVNSPSHLDKGKEKDDAPPPQQPSQQTSAIGNSSHTLFANTPAQQQQSSSSAVLQQPLSGAAFY